MAQGKAGNSGAGISQTEMDTDSRCIAGIANEDICGGVVTLPHLVAMFNLNFDTFTGSSELLGYLFTTKTYPYRTRPTLFCSIASICIDLDQDLKSYY